jgi:hypothetical protein
MKTKPPVDRRKFNGIWDEINYLRDKLLYWLYARENTSRALPYARRLQRLLPKADPAHESIVASEAWSLAFEAEGRFPKAIERRENEIRLIRRLLDVSRGLANEQFILATYGFGELSDRLDLLAMLRHNHGDLDGAIRALRESRELCEEHGIKFDGVVLLRDYLAARRTGQLPLENRKSKGARRRPTRAAMSAS